MMMLGGLLFRFFSFVLLAFLLLPVMRYYSIPRLNYQLFLHLRIFFSYI